MTDLAPDFIVPKLDVVDRLFLPHDEHGQATAFLNLGHAEHGYIYGYRMLSDQGVEYVLETGWDRDYLVFPIVFGYRQYLELRTKDLLSRSTTLLDRPRPDTRILGGHRLVPLWAVLAPMIEEIFGEDPQIALIGDRMSMSRSLAHQVTKPCGASLRAGGRSWRQREKREIRTGRRTGSAFGILRGWALTLAALAAHRPIQPASLRGFRPREVPF